MAPTGDSGETEAFDRQESGSAPKRDGPSPSAHPATDRTDREGNRSSQPQDLEFAIDPRRVLRTLLTVTAVLVVLSTAGQVAVYYLPDFALRDSIANLFYVRMEQNVPTLYSSMLLLVAALLCVLIARAYDRTDHTYVRHWAALSIVFLLLSFDEFASIHEQATDPLREQLGITGGPLFFAWVIPGAALVALFGIALLRFLRHLPRPTRRRLLAAGTLFISGAMGFEMIGGAYKATYGPLNMGHVLIVTAEETLEMVGVVVLLYGLLAYIPAVLPDVVYRVRVTAVG
jgi:hypothetical protein